MSKVFKNKQIQISLLSMVYSAQQGEHSASWGAVGEQTGVRQRPDSAELKRQCPKEPGAFTESIGTALLKMVVGVLCTSELNCAQNCVLEKAGMLCACFSPWPLTDLHSAKQRINKEEWKISKC